MTDPEIEAFVRAFEDGSLSRAEWTHDGHLVMALWYLRLHPRDEATCRIRDGIRSYNRSQGNHSGYHETITLAWIEVIGRFLDARDRHAPASMLAAELLETLGSKDYLFRHYSREVLMSDEARAAWVPPDRLGFATSETAD